MASKTVLLKYLEHKRKVLIPAEKEASDLAFLESSFREALNYEKLVDLEHGDHVIHLGKLNIVVTPVLDTPQTV